MNPSQANPREYQWQAIDAEIKSLEESIRTLRLRRNALVPVSSLPPEVITSIFTFLHLRVTALTLGENPEPLAWLHVAHVCHQWREIALNQPLFLESRRFHHPNFSRRGRDTRPGEEGTLTFGSKGSRRLLGRCSV